MIKAKFSINFTNLIGSIGLCISIFREFEAGAYICGFLVLGRAGVDMYKQFIENKKSV